MRIAIYTCITHAYDRLLQPAVAPPEGFDFICFVGAGEKHAERDGIWQIREIPAEVSEAVLGRTAYSRYPKMHPHLLLPDYDASVWVDGNIQLNDTSIYEAAAAKSALGVPYSGVPHPTRTSLFSESRMCRNMGHLSWWQLFRVDLWLLLHGARCEKGFQENNLIFRRHNDPRVVEMDGLWWRCFLKVCRRDQLTFMWCLRKAGLTVDYFLGPGLNTRNHPGFTYLLHR